ncbi:Mucosal addressin cell adhesion molecule 1 [Sciurus carolinensis]|uniref:Mucosal addressin cell adhesion molecule 1 n=1 Tax=Sciurus carolinensis TaxID=30640 RepID=A0AA41N0Z3_SCICA|nr:Mucosal addressin cell adhesion molecule 1 [Sciurus carolinensis]
MEQGLALLLALSLGLLQPGRSQPLRVEPPEPVVALAIGASRQFTCSLACARGTAAVRWRGLDTNLGAVRSEAGGSVLSVRNASLSAAGTRVCVGSCGDRTFQHTVRLLVYAFPDQLTVSPATLVPGRDQEVACTAHGISPAGPDALFFSLLLGNRELEGVQALGREEEEEDPEETEDLLFRVTKRWLLPPLGTPTPTTLHCQATMRLPGLELSHRRALPVLHSQISLEPTDPTSSDIPNTTSPQATPQQGSTGTPRINSSTETCHPEIHQSLEPALDGEVSWELLCETACGPGMAVRWTLAPGGLAAYQRREAGARAWLSRPPGGSSTEGLFQCRLDPGGQVASFYVPGQKVTPKSSPGPRPEERPPPAALWTGSLVLGLLLMPPLAYRLWRRCRPPPATPARPPASLWLLPVRD